ncbi:MAG: MerR family transcriptional regulator [Candidatus Gracilibacteria bacterium]|nr:MerR family transcriptional regulator [Candidatus Gracilibacteria bacterium]
MNSYTVKQLANLVKVTIKTLHHYDEMGLLKPTQRTDAGYRLYNRDDLLKLQQIMIYKEMEFSLKEIKQLLEDPDFDIKKALHEQKKFLLQQQKKTEQLVQTIDKTIKTLQEDEELVTDAELYEGFTAEKAKRYNQEAKEKYGEMFETSQNRVGNMTKGQWKAIRDEGKTINKEMLNLIGTDPNSDTVQAVIKRHHAWVENFYPCNKETYVGLSDLYIENPEFTTHYERFASGLAVFMSSSMKFFAKKL